MCANVTTGSRGLTRVPKGCHTKGTDKEKHMNAKNNFNLLNELNEVCNDAWTETVNGLTPEEREAMTKITAQEWAQAIVEVAAEIVTGFAQMLRKK